MSQCANWLIRTTSIFLVIPLTSLPECKITILGRQNQGNEEREVRIYTIKNNTSKRSRLALRQAYYNFRSFPPYSPLVFLQDFLFFLEYFQTSLEQVFP